MRLAPVLGLTAVLSAAACGGSTSKIAEQQTGGTAGSGAAAGNGAAGGGGTGASAGSFGFDLTSYDLKLENVTRDGVGFSVPSPSEGRNGRLDWVAG
jgi:hypothetical protein